MGDRMGLFRKSEPKPKIVLAKDARCDRCGKKIRNREKFLYADGKLYCESCARAKKDWEFLEMMALFED